jgi:hypothetical protein
MVGDLSALMRISQTRGAKKVGRGEQDRNNRNGEVRVPGLCQWKDQEMADDMLKLMTQNRDGEEAQVLEKEKHGDVEMRH